MKKLTIPNGHKLPNHLFVGCDDGEIDWKLVQTEQESGSISGMIYKHENEVFAYLGN